MGPRGLHHSRSAGASLAARSREKLCLERRPGGWEFGARASNKPGTLALALHKGRYPAQASGPLATIASITCNLLNFLAFSTGNGETLRADGGLLLVKSKSTTANMSMLSPADVSSAVFRSPSACDFVFTAADVISLCEGAMGHKVSDLPASQFSLPSHFLSVPLRQ